MNLWKTCLIMTIVIVAASACAPPTPAPAAASSLVNTEFALESFQLPDGEDMAIPDISVTLQFDGSGHASGSGGCNDFSAAYSVQGNTLSFSDITHTEKSCPTLGVDAQEQQYFEALRGANRFEQDGIQLKIWYDGGDSYLSFVEIG